MRLAHRRHRRRAAVRRFGRHLHHVLVWLGSIVGVIILALAVGVWRLMQGPIELDDLIPYVERAFDRADIGLGIKVSGVKFCLVPATHEVRLWANGVHASTPNGEPVANFPEMETSFRLGSLLRGRLIPTEISVDRAVVHLKRHEAGAITFRVGDLGDGAADFGPQIIDHLIGGKPTQDTGLGALRRMRIRDATVILDDKSTGKRWRATHVDAAVVRSPGGLDGDIALAFPLAGGMPEFRAGFRYEAAQQTADVTIAAEGIDPAAIASLLPDLRPLAQFQSTVAGTLTTRLDLKAGQSEGVRLDLGFGAGKWQNKMLPSGALDITSGELHAVYAPEASELRLEQFALDLGQGGRLILDGTLGGITPWDPLESTCRHASLSIL